MVVPQLSAYFAVSNYCFSEYSFVFIIDLVLRAPFYKLQRPVYPLLIPSFPLPERSRRSDLESFWVVGLSSPLLQH